MVAKTATIPDRPSRKIGKKRQSNGTFTLDGISNRLQLNDCFLTVSVIKINDFWDWNIFLGILTVVLKINFVEKF